MGCIFPKPDASNRNSKIFRVYNVDDSGEELNSGKIEVTDTDLILHQKGKEAIRWPLRCLRRYGWDQELFSFESGRRCPTGPGIYAFKCRRAENLFNSVQECIQRAGQQPSDVNASQPFDHNASNNRPSSTMEMQQINGFVQPGGGRRNIVQTPDTGELNYINSSVVTEVDADHQYVNTGTANHAMNHSGLESIDPEAALIDFLHNPNFHGANSTDSRPTGAIQYVELDLPASTENLCDETLEHDAERDGLPSEDIEENANGDVFDDPPFDAFQNDYMNVGASRDKKMNGSSALQVMRNTDHNYLNINLPMSSPTLTTNLPAATNSTLNYIEVVNLNGTGPVVPTPSAVSFIPAGDSPGTRTDSYTMIDFAKTEALSNSARNKTTDVDEGPRKTRHNSTINS